MCVGVCVCMYWEAGNRNLSLWVYAWLLTPHPGEEERSKHAGSPLLLTSAPPTLAKDHTLY